MSNTRTIYFRFYPRDFFDGTVGLTLETKGAYALVIALMHQHDGKLPDDGRYISGHIGCSLRKWNELKRELLIRGKVTLSHGYLENMRVINDQLAKDNFIAKQTENGSKPKKNNGLTEAKQQANQQAKSEPNTIHYTLIKAPAGLLSGEGEKVFPQNDFSRQVKNAAIDLKPREQKNEIH